MEMQDYIATFDNDEQNVAGGGYSASDFINRILRQDYCVDIDRHIISQDLDIHREDGNGSIPSNFKKLYDELKETYRHDFDKDFQFVIILVHLNNGNKSSAHLYKRDDNSWDEKPICRAFLSADQSFYEETY